MCLLTDEDCASKPPPAAPPPRHVPGVLFILVERLLEDQEAVEETVADRKYKEWLSKKKYKELGLEVRKRVLDEYLVTTV